MESSEAIGPGILVRLNVNRGALAIEASTTKFPEILFATGLIKSAIPDDDVYAFFGFTPSSPGPSEGDENATNMFGIGLSYASVTRRLMLVSNGVPTIVLILLLLNAFKLAAFPARLLRLKFSNIWLFVETEILKSPENVFA